MVLLALGFALLAGVVAYVLLRRRATKAASTRQTASYAEVKQRIRAGVAMAPVFPPAPSHPLPLDQVLALTDSNRFVTAMYERIAHKVEQEPGLSASESAVLHIFGLEAEVNNGGFDQYFFNSAGDGATKALAALDLIGAVRFAGILREAIGVFGPAGPSPCREERWLQMDSFDEAAKAALDGLSSHGLRAPGWEKRA